MSWRPQTGSAAPDAPAAAHPEDCECFERCRVHPDAWQVADLFDTGPAYTDADGRL